MFSQCLFNVYDLGCELLLQGYIEISRDVSGSNYRFFFAQLFPHLEMKQDAGLLYEKA